MKERSWIFLRVVVYLCLAGAGLALSILFYFVFSSYRGLRSVDTLAIIFSISLASQILFNVLNVRLIHYHFFHKLLPGPVFSTWHTVLAVLNSCIAVAMICLFLYGFIETFKTTSYRNNPGKEELLVLVLIATYTFITICTITGSYLLRRYIKHDVSAKEEEWLNHLGS